MRQPVKRQKIFDTLRSRIISGEAAENSFLPSEPKLAREFGVARETMRGALLLLEEAQLIERIRPRGTRVLPRRARGARYHAIGIAGYSSPLEDRLNYYDALFQEARAAGYELINIAYPAAYLRKHPSVLFDMPLDGILFAGSMIDAEVAELIRRRDFVVTSICRNALSPEVDSFDNNHLEAGAKALRYLLARGHRRVGCMRVKVGTGYSVNREERELFREMLGTDFDERAFYCPTNIVELYEQFGEHYRREMVRQGLASMPPGITAIYLDYVFAADARHLPELSDYEVVCFSEYPVEEPQYFPVVAHDRCARLTGALRRLIEILEEGKRETRHEFCANHFYPKKG